MTPAKHTGDSQRVQLGAAALNVCEAMGLDEVRDVLASICQSSRPDRLLSPRSVSLW
jgi:hypothetical protein